MKPNKNFKSRERALADLSMINWKKRLDIYLLRLKGMTFRQISAKLKCSKTGVHATWKKIKHLDLKEIEKTIKKLNQGQP